MGLGIQRFIFAVIIIAVLGVAAVQVWARTSRTPDTLGVVDGQLRDCPTEKSNCVVSGADDPNHAVPALECPGVVGQDLLARVRSILLAQPNTTIVSEEGNWIHAVSTTPFFGFRDDVEVLMQANLRFVDIRSASRLGSDDLGTNRERVLKIIADLEESCATS